MKNVYRITLLVFFCCDCLYSFALECRQYTVVPPGDQGPSASDRLWLHPLRVSRKQLSLSARNPQSIIGGDHDDTSLQAPIVIAYCTREGQTEKIAKRIAAVLKQETGSCVELQDIEQPCPIGHPILHPNTTAIIVGGSIRRFGHVPALAKFVGDFHEQLTSADHDHAKLTAFFSVGLMAAKDPNAAHNIFVRPFLNKVKWQPAITAAFGGSARYSLYDPFSHAVVSSIVRATGLDRPPWEDKEYTDWYKVDVFAREFGKRFLELGKAQHAEATDSGLPSSV